MLRRDSGTMTGRQISPNASHADLERLASYEVCDSDFENIGHVSAIWADVNSQAAFVGVQTGWLAGKTHVVPAFGASVNDSERKIRLAYPKRDIKNAPSYAATDVLDFGKEKEIFSYFRGKGPVLPELKTALGSMTSAGATAGSYMTSSREGLKPGEGLKTSEALKTREETAYAKPRADLGDTSIALCEEQLRVGKREVDGGGIRLRKIVRTEKVQQGIDLRHEELEVERVPAKDMKVGDKAFQNEEFYIPLRYEEAVIEKDARVREEYHAHKAAKTEHQTVSGDVRKEDIEYIDQHKAWRPEQLAAR